MNHDFAEYHVPVNADVDGIDVISSPSRSRGHAAGLKGLGGIGIVGTAAAVANAIFHATGTACGRCGDDRQAALRNARAVCAPVSLTG